MYAHHSRSRVCRFLGQGVLIARLVVRFSYWTVNGQSLLLSLFSSHEIRKGSLAFTGCGRKWDAEVLSYLAACPAGFYSDVSVRWVDAASLNRSFLLKTFQTPRAIHREKTGWKFRRFQQSRKSAKKSNVNGQKFSQKQWRRNICAFGVWVKQATIITTVRVISRSHSAALPYIHPNYWTTTLIGHHPRHWLPKFISKRVGRSEAGLWPE